MDIESYGIHSYYTAVLSAAASPDINLRNAAASSLITTAVQLTNGAFPANFPLNGIFTNSGVSVPLGVWASKDGEHDVREIDLAFIGAHTGDSAAMSRWNVSNLPREKTNVDPFQAKIEAISALVPDAVITGKATRVTFTAEFVNTLMSAAAQCGLVFTYEPEVNFDASSVNWASVGTALASGGIDASAINGVAREYLGNTVTGGYYVPYTNMWANRR